MRTLIIFNCLMVSFLVADGDDTNIKRICLSEGVTETDVLEFLESSNPRYTADARPRRNSNAPVILTVGLHLYGIKDFDEHDGTLILEGFLSLQWYDEYLVWNMTFPFNCVKSLVVQSRPVWRPDIVIITNFNSEIQSMITDGKVELDSDGLVATIPQGQISTNCDLDLTFFPFDTQVCNLVVDSWKYDNFSLQLTLENPPFTKVNNFWSENRQWEMVENSTRIVQVSYTSPTNCYYRAVFTMVLRRHPLFYYINVIIPSIVIAMVELVTFLLPVSEVTKIPVSVTCLLAYSVFQGMIIGDMPRSGRYIPMLSLYIDLQMAYIALIAIMGQGIALYFVNKSYSKYGPHAWMTSISHFIGRILGCSQQSSCGEQSVSSACRISALNHQYNDSFRIIARRSSKSSRYGVVTSPSPKDWLHFAEITERLNLILYFLANFITPLVMFFILPGVNDNISVKNQSQSNM